MKKDPLRETKEYQKARRIVLKRDNYHCQYPGCKSRSKKYLQVHHIIRHADSIYLSCNPRNLITLCFIHHKKIWKKEHNYVDMFREIVRRKYEN